MTVKKMLVVTLNDTKGVVCAITRTANGAPPAEDLVGAGLVMRTRDKDNTVTVPATELKVTEVDYSEDVLRNPLGYVIDATTNTVVAPSLTVQSVVRAGSNVNVKVNTPSAGKTVVVVVDAGAGRDPMKFTGQSDATTPTSVHVTGVPAGNHLILASMDGYGGLLDALTF